MKKLLSASLFLFSSLLFAQWTQLTSTNTIEFRSIETSGSLIVAGAEGRGVFISTDNGDTWNERNTGLQNVVYVNSIAIAAGGIFIGTDNGIFYTSDNGLNWNSRNTGLTDVGVLKISILGANMFAAGNSGIFYSNNNGLNWTLINNGITNITMRDVFAVNGYVYAGGGGGVYISANNGSNWTQINTGLPSIATGRTFTLIGTNIFAGTHGYGVFTSAIGNNSWTAANSGALSNAIIEKLITVGTNIFASTWGQGIFVTINSGSSWSLVNDGYPNLFSKEIAANGTYIFAVGSTDSKGIYRRPLSQMIASAENLKMGIPQEYSLEQNFPNPFNPSTMIRYKLPRETFVRLSVYDNLGREVALIINETMPAGDHLIEWKPENISSGVYFITMNCGYSLFIRKAVFVK